MKKTIAIVLLIATALMAESADYRVSAVQKYQAVFQNKNRASNVMNLVEELKKEHDKLDIVLLTTELVQNYGFYDLYTNKSIYADEINNNITIDASIIVSKLTLSDTRNLEFRQLAMMVADNLGYLKLEELDNPDKPLCTGVSCPVGR